MLWPSFDLGHNETLKSSRLSIPASEVSSLITMFLSEQPYFNAALANKGPAFFPRLLSIFMTYFPTKLCSFQNGSQEKFAFFLQFCFFSFPFVAIGDMLNSGLYSQHSLPPSGSVCATPPHLPVLLPLYAIWFMNSVNITVLFRKKKITFSFDPLPLLILLPLIPFLLQKSLLSPFFSKVYVFFWFKNHYFSAFWEFFYQCRYLLSTPSTFSISISLSVIPEELLYFSYLSSPQCSFHTGSPDTNSTVTVILHIFGQTVHFTFWTLVHWN